MTEAQRNIMDLTRRGRYEVEAGFGRHSNGDAFTFGQLRMDIVAELEAMGKLNVEAQGQRMRFRADGSEVYSTRFIITLSQ